MTDEDMAEGTDAVDDKVLALRIKGRSFARIAEAVGLAKGSEATRAFNRALRRQPADKQADIRTDENGRLDRMVSIAKADESLSAEALERRLAVIDRLRARLMSEG